MATKHTTHYQLNLWEPEDSFLRTEFNENSAKIDAALTAHDTRMNTLAAKSACEYLYTQTLSTTDSGFSVDMTGIDWSKWSRVEVRFKLYGSGSIYFRPNSSQYEVYCSGTSGYLFYLHFVRTNVLGTVILLPCQNASKVVEAISFGSSGLAYGYCNSLTFSSLSTLDLQPNGSLTLNAGCKAEIYGVR